jgi:type IV secretory pathway component VirB8
MAEEPKEKQEEAPKAENQGQAEAQAEAKGEGEGETEAEGKAVAKTHRGRRLPARKSAFDTFTLVIMALAGLAVVAGIIIACLIAKPVQTDPNRPKTTPTIKDLDEKP